MKRFLNTGQQILPKLCVQSYRDPSHALNIEKQGTKKGIDQLDDRNLHVQDHPESSVYTGLPVIKTIPTAAVWA